jgi:hypothetical protein
MATETQLQLFDLCVQFLAEEADRNNENVWRDNGIMRNQDACMSLIYNYFIKHQLDEERRATLKITLTYYALTSSWLQSDFSDYCSDNKVNDLTFPIFLNTVFLESDRYNYSRASGDNGTKDIFLGTLCLLRDMLKDLEVASTITPNPALSIRDSAPDPKQEVRPWGV